MTGFIIWNVWSLAYLKSHQNWSVWYCSLIMNDDRFYFHTTIVLLIPSKFAKELGLGSDLPSLWRSRGFLLEGDLTVAIRWEGPLGSSKNCFWSAGKTVSITSIGSVSTQHASFSHHFHGLRERPSSGRCPEISLVSLMALRSGNVEELDLSVLGPGGEVMSRVPCANWEKPSMFEEI